MTHLLFMAQAFERAGDHTKNLAEELVHLVGGHSVRHVKKTRAAVLGRLPAAMKKPVCQNNSSLIHFSEQLFRLIFLD